MTLRLRLLIATAALFASMLLLISKITFDIDLDADGLFVLRGENGQWFELNGDLVPEDAPRLIWAMPLYPFKKVVEGSKCSDKSQACIDFRWNKQRGRGFIKNTWPDGSKLVINLGRFKDSNGKYPSGIFIGGGLPPADPDYRFLDNDATGMTYFDGQRWHHVWCNSNEGLISPSQPNMPSYPSDWTLKSSWVRENNGRDLTIESNHSLTLNGVPMDAKRMLFYTTGNSYVILSTVFTNRGKVSLPLTYMYGDEPWIGEFGSSAGDIGWTGKELILTEREINTTKYSYFGMFDYGNELAGEEHRYSGIANFIEWDKDSKPNKAYISNFSGGILNPDKIVPLVSPSNRFIGLQYGPYILQPGASFGFTLAVGMAGRNQKNGLPIKPTTELNR